VLDNLYGLNSKTALSRILSPNSRTLSQLGEVVAFRQSRGMEPWKVPAALSDRFLGKKRRSVVPFAQELD
jgi:hypothetical protein